MRQGFEKWAVYHKRHGGEDKFELDQNLIYHSMDGATYVVPAGFVSDLGSIPRILWNIIPRDFMPSSFLLHDYLCEADWISRRDGDKLLLEALKLSGAPDWKALLIYWAVRVYAILWRIK